MNKGYKNCFIILTIIILTLLATPLTVSAVPYNGEIFKFKQPDGTTVQAAVYGDEFYHRVESLDGYTLIQEPDTRWICYANLNKNKSDLISTGIKYRGNKDNSHLKELKNISGVRKKLKLEKKLILEKVKKAQRELGVNISYSTPISGQTTQASSLSSTASGLSTTPSGVASTSTESIRGLTILIDFPDEKSIVPKQEIEAMLNQPGYSGNLNNGSIRDYFYDVSGQKVEYTNTVTEFYTAPNNKAYYNDPSLGNTRVRELIKEAIQYFDANGYDFSTLSTNSGGCVRGFNLLYAGEPDVVWAQGLWPHQGSITEFSVDGVKFYEYQISNIGDWLTIGTIAHENGHLLFNWPDTYDYGYESAGTGMYDLMSYHHWQNPTPPNPYFRNILAGWGTATDLSKCSNLSGLTMPANSYNPYVYYNNANPNEMFMIENVQKTGRYGNLEDEGLLIWHIDKNGSNDYEEMTPTMHYMVSVEQADGLFHLEGVTKFGNYENDLFHAGIADKFDNTTVPDSKWWSGQESYLSISNISAQSTIDGSISMDISLSPPSFESIKINNNASYTNSRTVTLNITSSNAAQMMVSNYSSFTGATWESFKTSKSWTLPNSTNGTYTVYIKFKNASGVVSAVYSDSIVLNTVAPTGSIKINNNDPSTGNPFVSINCSSSTDAWIMLSNTSSFTGAVWQRVESYINWVLTAGNGTKTVYAKFKDVAGNESIVYSDSITLNMTAPVGRININNYDRYTSSTNVSLYIVAVDASKMMISNSSGFTGSAWEAYSTTKNWVLTSGDGTKGVYIKFKNAAGVESSVNSTSIILDETLPTGTIVIDSYKSHTNSVTLPVSVYPACSDADQMMISNDSDFNGVLWEAASCMPKNWVLTPGDGAKTVYMKLKDKAGNESILYSDGIILDTIAPTGSISINNGASTTNTIGVTLNISAVDANQMMVSNDSGFTGSVWQTYSTTKSWTLTLGNGTKTVYIKFKDSAGNISPSYSDTITLNETTIPTGSIRINDCEIYSNNIDTLLFITYLNAAQMMISNNFSFTGGVWESCETLKIWTLNSGDGTKTVYLKFKSAAGNESIVYSDSIILDTVAPTGSVSINNGAALTSSVNVTLNISSVDANYMMVANDSGFTGGIWEAYSSTKNWTLSSGDGSKTIYIKFKDPAGNNSIIYNGNIMLDTTAPTGSIGINNGAASTDTTNVTLYISAVDAEQIMVSNDSNFTGALWESYATTKSWTLTPGAGTKTVYIKFKDAAGNISQVYNDTIDLSEIISGIISTGGALNIPASANGQDVSKTWTVPSGTIAKVHFKGTTESGYDYGYLYYYLNNTWTQVSKKSGTWDTWISIPAGVSQIKVRYTTDGSILKSNVDAPEVEIGSTSMAPTGSIKINNDAAYSNSTAVTLNITYSNAVQMMVSNSSSFTGGAWESCAATKSWTLTSGDGTKTVYIKFKDAAGTESIMYSDTITLDTAAPTGSISINNGASSTSAVSVTLDISAVDANQMMVSNDSSFTGAAWEAYSTAKSWTLTSGSGTKTVYIKFKDLAGNISSVYSDTISLSGTTTGTVSTGGALNIPASANGQDVSKTWTVPSGTIAKVHFKGTTESGYDYGYLYYYLNNTWTQVSKKSGTWDTWISIPAGVSQIKVRYTTDGSILKSNVDAPEVQTN